MEVLEQGLVNHVTLVRAMRTTFATQLFVDAANNESPARRSDGRVYYYGLSQGGIFGTAVMAYEPTVTRAVLGVGARELLDAARALRRTGRPTARSSTARIPIRSTTRWSINLMQMRWDKTEGSGVVNTVLDGHRRPGRRRSSS